MKLLSTLITVVSLHAFAADLPQVIIETSMGTIEAELDSEKAPVSVQNFLSYVDSGFYSNTTIHRVVKNFVIQGGGVDKELNELPTAAPIISEATNGLSNLKGTLGMARSEDINSATSQFYINTKDNIKLDHTSEKYGYAVFGKVTKGYEIVEAIENVAVTTVGEYQNVPVEPILILSVRRK
ncbi:MAG: peptidylprolyl isomerase [Bdellovibrionota bacterium]